MPEAMGHLGRSAWDGDNEGADARPPGGRSAVGARVRAGEGTAAAGLFAAGLWGTPVQPSVPAEDSRLEVAAGEPQAARVKARGRGDGRRRRWRDVLSREPFQGRYTEARRPRGRICDVAWDATLRGVAHLQRGRRESCEGSLAIQLDLDELLVKQRVRRPGQLLLFVADASGSMGTALTELAKRIGGAALRDAYLKRAQVAVIAFRDRSAALLCAPTRKVGRVHGALEGLPLGGTTPLASGLELACETLGRARRHDPTRRCTVVLMTDGRANVGSVVGHERVLREVETAARRLAALPDVPLLLLDTTEPGKNDQAATRLSRWLGADRLALGEVVGNGRALAPALARALGRWNLSPGSFPARWQ